MIKNYVGISRDHSGSMNSIRQAAARDYNATISGIREQTEAEGQDTIVSVVRFGSRVEREVVNSTITALQPMNENAYRSDMGMTSLLDSVGELIEMFEQVPDKNDPDVSFLVMAITDGEENQSRRFTWTSLASKIKQLQATDRWTFVFRVPRGYGRTLANYGIPAGNILEWDQTNAGMEQSTVVTRSAFEGYFKAKSAGVFSTDKFYTNVADLTPKELKKQLVDISSQVNLWQVTTDSQIRPFCEAILGAPMVKGAAFYQLTKTESEVQDYKQIAIRDKVSGAVYSGAAARDLLSLPQYGMAKVAPGDHGQYDIYIQSTSINRKLPAGTTLLYWPYAGVTK